MDEYGKLKEEAGKHYEKSVSMSYMALVRSLDHDVKKAFSEQGINKVIIYGMGEEGAVLFHLFRSYGLGIEYVTDRNFEDLLLPDVNVVSPEEVGNDADAILVSSNYYFEEIKHFLEDKVDIPVLSAKEVFENILLNPVSENI